MCVPMDPSKYSSLEAIAEALNPLARRYVGEDLQTQRDQEAVAQIMSLAVEYAKSATLSIASRRGQSFADDISQDIACLLLMKFETFRGDQCEFSSWLYSCVRNRIFEVIRNESKRRAKVTCFSDIDRAQGESSADEPKGGGIAANLVDHRRPDGQSNTLRLVDIDEDEINAALKGLSPKAQEVIKLRIAALSYQEIADRLNLPLTTIRRRLQRALKGIDERGNSNKSKGKT